MEILILVLIAAAIAVLAPLFGADSRDGMDWAPSDREPLRATHVAPGRRLVRLLRRRRRPA